MPLRSFGALAAKLRTMDRDEGIRVEAAVPGFSHGGFLFITRSDGRYCLNLCDRVLDEESGRYLPGGREQWEYLDLVAQALAYVRERTSRKLLAYAY